MYIRRSAVFAAAALAFGCSGEVGNQPGDHSGSGASDSGSGGSGPGSGGTNPTGSGGTKSGGTGGTSSPTAGTGNSAGTSSGGTGNTGPVTCVPGIPGTSQIPRLTNAQYDRTVRDLVGITNLTAADNVTPSTRLATDQAGGMSALAWANYKDVADKIATQVMGDPAAKAKFLKCTPAAGNTCLHDTVLEFGRRAFRRALTPDEIARFDNIIDKGAEITPTGAPEEVAQTLLFMFLISPSFLQRAEITEASDGSGHYMLSSAEIASRLSYMLWGTTPDAVLDQAVDANQLTTPDQIAAQATRMLQDPRAREMVNSFHQYYLLMRAEGRWGTANRDLTTFPNFKPEMVPAITEETLKLFDKIAFTPGASFKDLLTTQTAFVNKDTAPLYGLSAATYGTDLTEVQLDATRPGFLTRAGFLMNFASYTRTNPIYRGAFITKQILGLALDAPPPGAGDTPLPTGADLTTNRKQVEAQTGAPTCIGCHGTFVNPPGFVMEAFDAMAAARTTEADGTPLDTTAMVTFDKTQEPVSVSTPAELIALIASSPTAMKQYATKWVSYAYAREGDPTDACVADQIATKMASGAYPILTIISDLTQAESFRIRALEVTQ